MDKYILSLFLLMSISGAASAVLSVNGEFGRSVYFSVFLPNQPIELITWNLRNNLVALYINGAPPRCLSQFIGRCTIFHNGSLILNNITYNDEGMYTMNAENNAGNILKREIYQLRVYAPLSAPVLHIITFNSPIINGTDVTLQCDPGNQNVTSYTFHRDGQKIICSEPRVICRGSFLDFTPISENDGGSYTCTIQNPVSANISRSRSLTVYVRVSNVAVTSNVSGLVWPGLDSVSLRCSACGTNVSYSWSLQGAPISAGGRYILTDSNATLIINPVFTDDSGSFVCTAKNVISSQNSNEVRLSLASPVSAVTLTSNTSAVLWAGQDSVSLHCSAQGSAITFSWRLNGEPVSLNPPYYITRRDSPPNSNLTISPVSRHDTGPFTCKADNKANGATSNAANLNINWSPDGNIACTAQPINQIVQLGCSWPGGKPAANVTMIFGEVQNTSTNQVFRNVRSSSNIHRSSLTCNGNHLGRTSSCVLTFEPPKSPDHKNDTITPGVVGGAVNLTVDLKVGAQSRGRSSSFRVLSDEYSKFQNVANISIQNDG